MKFNTTILDSFRKEFEKTVKPLEEKFKVKIKCGKINYSEDSFCAKLEVVSAEDNVEQKQFESYAGLFGFDKDDYNKVIKIKGQEFAFIGFNCNRPKWRCKIRNIMTGQEAATTEDVILKQLNKSGNKNLL